MSSSNSHPEPELNWVKADLHVHTSEDPCDILDYDSEQLLRRAAALGFGILAITLHRKVLWNNRLAALADELGIHLIPAVELRIEGCDTVVWNISASEAASIRTFGDLRRLKLGRGSSIMIMAPHPFYVLGGSLGKRLYREIDCFDAVEFCHFRTRHFDLNTRAQELAESRGLPLIATSDAHRLTTFGNYYTEIGLCDEFVTADVFSALKAGRLRNFSPPMSGREMLRAMMFIFVTHELRKLRRRLSPPRRLVV